MTISQFIKNYRRTNGISQKDFAQILGVADMTVSRIEAGQNYISTKVADALADVMKWDDFAQLDGSDPLVIKVKRAFTEKYPEYYDESDEPTRSNLFRREGFRFQQKDLCDKIDTLLILNDFMAVEESPYDNLPYDRIYLNEETQKYWVFFFPSVLAHTDNLIGISERILAAIGYTHLILDTNIRKVTVLAGLDDAQIFFSKTGRYQPRELPCDFSIISCYTGNFLRSEIDISLLGDGRGLFDTDSSNEEIRANELKRFSKWKRSLL